MATSDSETLAMARDPADAQDVMHDAMSRADVLLEVFCRLHSVSDLAQCCLVSRAWLSAARQDLAWKRVYVREYGSPHAWEACSSFRQQCARRAGLRAPRRPPTDGILRSLDGNDWLCCIRTLAVSYDPVTRCLMRAITSRVLVGDDLRVVVHRYPLESKAETDTGAPQTPPQPAAPPPPPPPVTAPAQLARGGAGEEDAAAAGDSADDAYGGRTGGGGGGIGDGVGDSSGPGGGRAVGGGNAQAGPSAAVGVAGEATAGEAAGRSATAQRISLAAGLRRWVCWVSADGCEPPPLPRHLDPFGWDVPDPDADPDAQTDEGAGGDDGTGGGGGGPAAAAAAAAPPAPTRATLTAEIAQQLQGLAELLPTVLCCAGGLLYLPAGSSGHGLAVWDLLPVAAAAAAEAGPPPPGPQQPHWLVADAHPGRLLAATADGGLAVSGCDGGRLRFWRGRSREALGSGDISHLTRSPVLPAFPQPTATVRPGAGRHRLRLALCEASGLAAVVLASPLTPAVYVYRAAPTAAAAAAGGSGRGRPAGGNAAAGTDGEGDGEGPGGVGQLLTCLTFGGAPGDGLALHRGCLLTMSVLCSDVMGARFGGSGGSSVLVTVTVRVWQVPGAGCGGEREEKEGEEKKGREGACRQNAIGGAAAAAATAADGACGAGRAGKVSEEAEARGGEWGPYVQLFSSRLQLEHPRTLVLGRMRPTLAATEDLLLLTAPRGMGGLPPHHQLLALQCGFGRELHAHPGFTGGEAPAPVMSEEERLPWMEVVEDVDQVIVTVVPTPHHLVLLLADGQLRLYNILP